MNITLPPRFPKWPNFTLFAPIAVTLLVPIVISGFRESLESRLSTWWSSIPKSFSMYFPERRVLSCISLSRWQQPQNEGSHGPEGHLSPCSSHTDWSPHHVFPVSPNRVVSGPILPLVILKLIVWSCCWLANFTIMSPFSSLYLWKEMLWYYFQMLFFSKLQLTSFSPHWCLLSGAARTVIVVSGWFSTFIIPYLVSY